MSAPVCAPQSPEAPAPSDYLGIVGKSSARFVNQRDALRRAMASLLFEPQRSAAAQHPTVWCGRSVLADAVGVYRRCDGASARIGGLATCKSVWACPVCALRVSETRRAELTAGMKAWKLSGGHVYLMTQTFRHHRDDDIAELLARFARAQKSFKQSAAYKKVSALAQRAGGVRSLETTWGHDNGWHPHAHELLFYGVDLLTLPGVRQVPDDARPGCMRFEGGAVAQLRDAWLACLTRAGLDGSQIRAFDIRDGEYAAEYVAKFGRDVDGWSVQDELTSAHAKIGKANGHYTPFQMLTLWRAGSRGAAWGDLLRAYVGAFQGQRMLYWSPKLKALLRLRDKTDEEIAAEIGADFSMPDEKRIGRLSVRQFATVYSRGAVAELLELARILDDPGNAQAALDDFCDYVKCRPRVCQERLRYRRALDGPQFIEYDARQWQ